METKEIETQICGLQAQEAVSESNKEAEKSNGDCVTKTLLGDSNVRNGFDPKSNESDINNDYRTLSEEEKTVKDSYLFCCKNFYSLPEMIIYMKENHGVSKTTATNVFRELLKGRNGEAYLRVSQKRMLQRRTLQRTSSGSGVGTSTK